MALADASGGVEDGVMETSSVLPLVHDPRFGYATRVPGRNVGSAS